MGAGASVDGGGLVVDPWQGVEPRDAEAKLEGEDGLTVVLASCDRGDVEESFKACCTDEAKAQGVRFIAEGINLDMMSLQRTISGSLGALSTITSLDLSSNALTAIPETILGSGNVLRHLNIAGNPLESCPDLSACCNLVSLDVSYCDAIPWSEAKAPFNGCASLRGLCLSSVGLTSLLTSPGESLLSGLTSLRSLSLSENDLEDEQNLIAGLAPVLVSLVHLELLDTPIAECADYKRPAFVERLGLRNLERIDDTTLNTQTKLRSLSSVVPPAETLGLDAGGPSSGEGGGLGMDLESMEREVDEAIKGHVDTSIVA